MSRVQNKQRPPTPVDPNLVALDSRQFAAAYGLGIAKARKIMRGLPHYGTRNIRISRITAEAWASGREVPK